LKCCSASSSEQPKLLLLLREELFFILIFEISFYSMYLSLITSTTYIVIPRAKTNSFSMFSQSNSYYGICNNNIIKVVEGNPLFSLYLLTYDYYVFFYNYSNFQLSHSNINHHHLLIYISSLANHSSSNRRDLFSFADEYSLLN